MKIPVPITHTVSLYDETALDHNIDLYKACDFDILCSMISRMSNLSKTFTGDEDLPKILEQLNLILSHQISVYLANMRPAFKNQNVPTGHYEYKDQVY